MTIADFRSRKSAIITDIIKRMKKTGKKGLKDLRPGARNAFLELCNNLGHILIGAKHLDDEEIIELTEKGLNYMKFTSAKVVDRLMKKCGL